ncbi:MAG: flagellar hook-basal body complex protein FliE [Saccharospirillaceae bacterium]|nr:flagellar hook-basal body complex protein FliE [Pseudomonadales bacterium]NRB79386.1 flagellar hook-basal body complex protein FliE [Saccharospirillaceae bacterium]
MSVDRMDISQVLSQMRALKSQMPSQNMNVNPIQNDAFKQKLSQVQNQVKTVGQPDSFSRINNNVDGILPVEKNEGPSFGDMFKSAIDTVNDSKQHANDLSARFEQGDPSVDLPEVMIALQKSSISFQAMTQVRNKMVEAYKEIMNMPL